MAVYDFQERGTARRSEGVVGPLGQHRDDRGSDCLRHRDRRARLALVHGEAGGGGRRALRCAHLRRARQRSAQGQGHRRAAHRPRKFARTGYAPRGALVLAKLLFDAGDAAGARAQLQWVIDRADEPALKEIARYRLAELLLDEKQYDQALAILDAKHGDAFAGLYADLRGDALAAAGKTAEARTAYETALAELDAKSQYRQYVQVKLESIGGTAPKPAPAAVPAGGGSGAAAAPAAAPAAPAAPAKK